MTDEETGENTPQTPADAPIIEEVRPEIPLEPPPPAEGELPSPPRNEFDLAYRMGRLETRLVAIEKHGERLGAILADFEMATAEALAADAAQDEAQSEVIDEIAAKVLPEDHEEALAHNPDHALPRCKPWEAIFGGCPRR